MGIALNTAISGLLGSQNRFATAAGRVVEPTASVAPAPQPLPAAPERPAGIRPPARIGEGDIFGNIVDLKQAETGYKAAAKVLAAISDTEKSLLDILS